MVPEGSVVITPADMYREISDIGRKVDRLTTLVDPAMADHEARIRVLERKLWMVAGAALLGGGSIGGALSQILS